MEQNVYRSELDRVRFTEEGKSALTEALLAERAAPAEKRHRRPWMKRGVAAALAAVLLVGSAAAVTVSLWDGFFGELDPSEQAVVDTLSGDLPGAVSSNGAVMTPLAAFGEDGVFYLMLEIQAPEGTVLPVLDGERETYQLFGEDLLNEWLELLEPDGGDVDFSYSTEPTWLADKDPTDNVVQVVVSILADGELEGKVLHIPGLWKQTEAKMYTEIFSGDFDFTLSGGLAEGSLWEVDVTGITAQSPYSPLTLDHLELSPLGLRWGYHYDEAAAQAAWEAETGSGDAALVTADGGEALEFSDMVTPDAELLLVLKDGTTVDLANGFGESGDGWVEQSGFFTRPVDLTQAEHLLWGDTEIPLN